MSADILTLTLNPALDVTTSIEALVPRRKLRCAEPVREAGGGGVNVSRAIRELGGQSHAFILTAGAIGAQYRDLVGQTGIAFTNWEGQGETRSSLTVMEHQTGQHYRFVLPGPHQPARAAKRLRAAILKAIGPSCRFVIGSGSVPPGLPEDIYAVVATHCRETGRRFILDTSFAPLRAGLSGRPFLVKLNHLEASDLVGGQGVGERRALHLGEALKARYGIEAIVITLGENGAVLVSDDLAVHLRPPRVRVESTVGAGDSFIAALALRLEAGAGLLDAVRYGVAAAASAVTTPASRLCTREQTDQILAQVETHSA